MSDTSGYNPQSGRDQIVQALMNVQNPPPGGADPTGGARPSLPGVDLTAGPTSGGVNPMAPAIPSYAGSPGNLPMGRPSPTPPLVSPPGTFGSQPQAGATGVVSPTAFPMPQQAQSPPGSFGSQSQAGALGIPSNSLFPQQLGMPPRY